MSRQQRSAAPAATGVLGRAAGGWLALAAAAGTAAAQEARWTNATGDGLWHTPGNWSTQRVPGSGDAVVIEPNMAPVVAQAAINSVLSVSAQSPLAIGHGVSSLAQASSFTDLTVINNVFSAGGPVLITGTSLMAGVTLAGPVQWKSTGPMRVNPGLVVQSGTVFINEGTVGVEGSLTLSAAGSLMDNRGTLTLIDAAPILSNGVLINSGTLRKTGAGVSNLHCRTQGNGPIDVQGGSLWLTGPVALGPIPVTVAPGSQVVFQPPGGAPFSHALSGPTFSGSGTVAMSAGGTVQAPTMRVEADTTFNLTGQGALSFENGMIRVGSLGVVRNSGNLRWRTFRVHGPGELVNERPGNVLFAELFSPVIGPDTTVINRAYALVATNITIDAAMLVNEGDGLLELGSVQVNSPNPSQAALVNRSALVFPPEAAPIADPEATVRCRFEQGGGGFTWARPGERETSQLSFLAGGEFGAGGSEIQIGARGQNLGAKVSLGGGTFRVTSRGHVVRDSSPNATLLIENAGTIVEVTPAGELELNVGASGSGTFDAVRLRAPAQLGGPGPIRNLARFVWEGQVGVGGVADFRNEPGAETETLTGGPTLRGTFTNADEATVIQRTSLDMAGGNVQNHGLWRFRPANAATISGANATFKNHKRFESDAAGGTVSVTLDNPGHVVSQGGTLRVSGPVIQIVGDALTGGTWEASGSGKLVFTQALLRRFDGATIIGGTEGIPAAAGVREVTRGGEVRANDSFLANGPLTTRDNGKVAVEPGPVNVPGGVTNGAESGPPDPSRIEQRARREGPAPVLITPTLVNHAHLFPGGEGEPGPFNLVGDLDQGARGVLHIDLGGTIPEADFDRLTIDGDAALGGTFSVRLIGTFIPRVGQAFDVLSVTGTLSGVFATLDLARLPGGAQLTVVYGPRGVALRVDSACYPDCDPSSGPGVLDIFDFLCFQNLFDAADPYACGCDPTGGPRVCDVFDFLCYFNAFDAGCP